MTVFKNIKHLVRHWNVVETRPLLNEEELSIIDYCTVVRPINHYNPPTCEFHFKDGRVHNVPLSNDYNEIHIGTRVDLNSIRLITLESEGDVIYRIKIKS